MKLNAADARRLASLSALAAGALVAGAGEAEAAVVYTALPPAKVGFSSGFNSSFQTSKGSVGGAGFRFNRTSGGPYFGSSGSRRSLRFSGQGGVNFATNAGMLKLFLAGSTIGGAGVSGFGGAASRTWGLRRTTSFFPGSSHFITTSTTADGSRRGYSTFSPGFSNTFTTTNHFANPGNYSNEFALFTFNFNSTNYYGWVELSLNNQNTFGGQDGTGPDLTISGWAFQDTNPLDAGDVGNVPEPGTLATTGLAALVLGAAGVRRWRASRPARKA